MNSNLPASAFPPPFSDVSAWSRRNTWLQLVPGYGITDEPFAPGDEAIGIEEGALSRAEASLLEDGYLVLPSIFDRRESEEAARLVQSVTAAGLPPPFALVYDHVWRMLGKLDTAFARLFGSRAIIIPDFWLWQLDGRYESMGWDWHRDDKFDQRCFDELGRPLILTVWVPFTEATVDNGCIHVLPRSADTKDPVEFRKMRVPDRLAYLVRPLPAPAGSILAWDMYALHRGGAFTSRATSPRISLGIYVQSAQVPSMDGHPVVPGQKLGLLDRLGMISRMITRYADRYGFSEELLSTCERWAALHSLAHDLPVSAITPPNRA